MLFESAFSGFAIGLSLIAAIGAQNVYVIKRGILGTHVLAVCLFCILSDGLLITIGVGGFGGALEQFAFLEKYVRYAGAIFLASYGTLAGWRAVTLNPSVVVDDRETESSLSRVLIVAFALTWLNPHVYLDTIFLLGALSTQYASRFAFGIGAVTASAVFFFSIGYGARFLAPFMVKPNALRALDFIIAVVMWAIAISLL